MPNNYHLLLPCREDPLKTVICHWVEVFGYETDVPDDMRIYKLHEKIGRKKQAQVKTHIRHLDCLDIFNRFNVIIGTTQAIDILQSMSITALACGLLGTLYQGLSLLPNMQNIILPTSKFIRAVTSAVATRGKAGRLVE